MDTGEIFENAKREKKGFFSVCTGNFDVIRVVLEFAKESGGVILIESTSNQVNQEGGYTGLRPKDFVASVRKLMEEVGVNEDKVILGGDHLGPLPWKKMDPEEAMDKGKKMVEEYVRAGYRKIHLDTSFPLGDEGSIQPEIVAERQADLCEVAEGVWREMGGDPPFYVLGTEVPPAGGVVDEEDYVTSAEEFERVVEVTRDVFRKRGLENAWERVIAFVVQPGVEFHKWGIRVYDPEKAKGLKEKLSSYHFVFEAHSTDFQPLDSLSKMVRDGFAILKVGPELTFKYREALFALEMVEAELGLPSSGLTRSLMSAMRNDPSRWRAYYEGTDLELKYSLLDRIRYYWSVDEVAKAKERLLENFRGLEIPSGLVSQYFPDLFEDVLVGRLRPTAEDLIRWKIFKSLDRYRRAVRGDAS